MANGKKNSGPGVEDEGHEVTSGELTSSLTAIERADIDSRVATAKRYPRSIAAFKRDVFEMATSDEETAGSCFYVVPRAGKKIEGPSVRLAEIAAACWGNLEEGARPVEVGDKAVIGEGICWDLERNRKCVWRVSRRITDKAGRRFGDDMINTTMLAAQAIAYRQAIFKVIPAALIKAAYEEAKKVSLGKALTMEQRRQREVDWYAKVGIKLEVLLRIAEKPALEDVGVDELVILRGVRTAITDGDTTVEQIIREYTPPAPTPGTAGSKLDQAAEALKTDVTGRDMFERAAQQQGGGADDTGNHADAPVGAGSASGSGPTVGAEGVPVAPAQDADELTNIRKAEIRDLADKLKLEPEQWDYLCQTHLAGATIDTADDAGIMRLRAALGQAWNQVQAKKGKGR